MSMQCPQCGFHHQQGDDGFGMMMIDVDDQDDDAIVCCNCEHRFVPEEWKEDAVKEKGRKIDDAIDTICAAIDPAIQDGRLAGFVIGWDAKVREGYDNWRCTRRMADGSVIETYANNLRECLTALYVAAQERPT